jgi:hypothetical protein
MIVGQEKPSLDDLIHFGVKGMRWGVIRDKTSDASSRIKNKVSSLDKKKLKKAAIITGSVLAAAAITAGTIYATKQLRGPPGGLNVSDISGTTGEAFVKKVFQEPTDIIHATRARTKGFEFRKKGGLPDAFVEWQKNDDGSSLGAAFKRYGDRSEKVVGTFLDPLGRKDQAGRVIPHTVILPEHLAKGVHNADDLFNKAWPLIKDDFEKFYDS